MSQTQKKKLEVPHMRIVINGQQAFGKACLESILNEGKDEVVAVLSLIHI